MPKILHLLLFAFAVDSILAATFAPEDPAHDAPAPAVNASSEHGWEDHPIDAADPAPDLEYDQPAPGAAATLLKESLDRPDEGPDGSH